jgi:asparagine synthase (glutamine-hydrolysing)
MCGINGIFAYADGAPPVEESELLRVRESMAKRGPDGAGLWMSHDRRVGLAHRRLTIIDLSEAGAQPMASADGRLRITFNGEIYNYRALRRELEQKGFVFRSQSDTEVLLHLYADRGADMVRSLRGMYAFGIWDESEKILFLARDPFGVKPLYYADQGGALRFASQVKALVRGGAVDDDPDPAGSAGFLLWGCVPEPFTVFRAIRALPAGTTMTVVRGAVRAPAPYFSVRDELVRAQQEAVPFQSRDREKLGALLRDSVRHHLVADVPVALFLSAGVDSTLVAGLAAEEAGVALRSLTLAFDEYRGGPDDEAPLAERTAALLRTRHETRWIRRGEFEQEMDAILSDMDQPSTDGVNAYLICREARRAGMKVALSGLGGDEMFGGYPSFRHVPRLARWLRAAGRAPWTGRMARRALNPLLREFTSPKYAGLLEYGGTLAGAYLLRRALFMPWELGYALDPDTVRDGLDRLQTERRLEESIQGVQPPRGAVSALEMGWYMRNQLLRDADWAGMAHSIEVRVPLVDAALFKAVAPWLASAQPPSKADAARCLALETLGAALARPKSGFRVPVDRWTKDTGALGGAARSRGLRAWARLVLKRGSGRRPRVLISTLLPSQGGVRTMTGMIVEFLRRRGVSIEIAHYIPYRQAPELSVPFWMLPFRRPSARRGVEFGDIPSRQIGTRLPELEWFRCLPSRLWRELVPGFDCFVTVSGSALSALPVLLQGERCLAWIATSYTADRRERARAYPWYRRIVDRLLDAPVCRAFEKVALRRADTLALSRYTAGELRSLEPGVQLDVMPMPIDCATFRPAERRGSGARIGFCGRFTDPRKNMALLFDALAQCFEAGLPVELALAGDRPSQEMTARLRSLGLADRVRIQGELERTRLAEFYNALDVFVIASEQEGLCIAGLEAMACGCPVVSTRCGGPEDYVEDGVNGILVGFSAQELAAAIRRLLENAELRRRMGEAAVRTVQEKYSVAHFEATFGRAFERVAGEHHARLH